MNTFTSTIDGIDYVLNRLTIREEREIQNMLGPEMVKLTPSESLDQLVKVFHRCVVSWSCPNPTLEVESVLAKTQVADVIRTTLAGGRVTPEERKKSE